VSPTTQGLLVLLLTLAMLLSGVPVAFGLGLISIVFLIFFQGFDALRVVAETFYGGLNDFTLVSIPMFVMMGAAIGSSPAGKDLYEALDRWLYRLPGGLVISNLGACAIFAALTGSSPACCAAIGKMGIPEMRRRGYPEDVATGSICAGGTLGILIPPSVMLVVMGPTIGVPVNALYASAFGPGFLLAAMYIVYCLVRSHLKPELGPPVPLDERVTDKVELVREFVIGVVPLALLIGFTLGTILAGLATPTEAASCGAVGATVLAAAYRKLTWKALTSAAMSTMITSSMVLFLAVSSNVFGAVFTQLGATDLIANAISQVPLPDMGKLLLIMALIFLLGWPFEWPAVILVFLPIFVPVVAKLNVGLSPQEMMIWFGALVAVNLQTAFLSPPVAMSAYYLKNVMPQWSLGTIYRGMGNFMIIQIICLAAVLLWPEIALWLPRVVQ